MDRRAWLATSLLLFTGRAARSEEDVDLREVITKGIAAAGGQERLARLKAQTWKSKQKIHEAAGVVEVETTSACELPGKFRNELSTGTVLVCNGDEVWLKQGEEVSELEGDRVRFLKEDLHATWVRTLIPLLDKDFRFKPVPQIVVEGRPTVGVRVVHRGHYDVALLFDKQTFQLLKTETRSRGLGEAGKLSYIETFFYDYIEVEGTQVATRAKLLRDGELFMEIEIEDIKRHESLGDEVFAKPE